MKKYEILEKKEKIRELFYEVYQPEFRFFDLDSDKLLDEKIEVLEALKEGKTIDEIPKYYDVLELLDVNQHWDL